MRSWQRCSGLLLAVVAVALVWPVSAGGQFGYVTTHGISMEPRFHTGDLAVVHPVSEYRVGDITAYHNRMLHTIVLHRIVAIDGDRYTFKGDNNSWLDQERPVRSQLIGTLVLRVPHGGVWLRRLISPPALGLAAFALLATGAAASRRRRRKRRMSRHAASRRRTHTATAARENVRPVAAMAAVVVTSALATLAWTHPETRLVQHKVVQNNSIALSYSANVKPTPVYDSTTVSAPTPVFRNVTDTVALHFRYQGAPAKLRLDATLTTPGGWTSTVPLASTRAFTAHTYTTTVPLNLDVFDRRARAASRITGLPATPLTITVVPRVTDRAGHTFAPQFPFTLTPLALTAPPAPSGLTASGTTSATESRRTQASLNLLRRHVSVHDARLLTLSLLAAALLAAAALLVTARFRGSRTEADEIQRRWAELLLDVQPMPTPAGRPVVDVPGFASLVRLAQRYELLVLHWTRSGVHTYIVQDDATVFRYRTRLRTPQTLDATRSADLEEKDAAHAVPPKCVS
jgi:signal peptidase I